MGLEDLKFNVSEKKEQPQFRVVRQDKTTKNISYEPFADRKTAVKEFLKEWSAVLFYGSKDYVPDFWLESEDGTKILLSEEEINNVAHENSLENEQYVNKYLGIKTSDSIPKNHTSANIETGLKRTSPILEDYSSVNIETELADKEMDQRTNEAIGKLSPSDVKEILRLLKFNNFESVTEDDMRLIGNRRAIKIKNEIFFNKPSLYANEISSIIRVAKEIDKDVIVKKLENIIDLLENFHL